MIKRKHPTGTPHPRPPLVTDMLPVALLDDPLAYILADHVRQRSICAALQDFADTRRAGRDESERVTFFLLHDRVIHHADEEQDLFPALRRKSLPEDNLGPVLARLTKDHRCSDAMVEGIAAALSAHPNRDPAHISVAAGKLMKAYAADEHRHLAIENGVVLVIAAIRLTGRDLRAMSRKMKARRGVPA
jgi:Hemerythrin HHE cation binding domain